MRRSLQKWISQCLAASAPNKVVEDEVPCGTEFEGEVPCGTDVDGWEEVCGPAEDEEKCVGARGGKEARGRA